MKHCAKKLLGLAFALALCLAVGGTALAQTPEFADMPDALPELEMLAYEPNVAMAEDTTTIGDEETPKADQDLKDLDDEDVPKSDKDLDGNKKVKKSLPLVAGVGIGVAALAALAAAIVIVRKRVHR